MKELFSQYTTLRPLLLAAILIGSIGVSTFYNVDYVESVPVIPVYGGVTGGCTACVNFCGNPAAVACVVGPPRPGRIFVEATPGLGWGAVPPYITVPGTFLYYQLRDGVWWLGAGRPGGACDIPAPHSGCIGFTITVTSLYNASSLGVGPLPIP